MTPAKLKSDELPLDAQIIEPEVKTIPPPEPSTALTVPVNSMDLLKLAIDKLGGPGTEAVVNAIERLADLQLKIRAIDAKAEFNRDLSAAQMEFPVILKSKKVDYPSKAAGGGNVRYNYTEIDKIATPIRPTLHKYGFSISWDTVTVDKKMKVTGVLRHKSGHQEQATFESPVPDSMAGMDVVKIQSAVQTTLMRRTLITVCGITCTEEDTDGNPEKMAEKIKPEIAAQIQSRVVKYGKTYQQFCELMKVEKIEDLTVGDMPRVNNLFQGMKAGA